MNKEELKLLNAIMKVCDRFRVDTMTSEYTGAFEIKISLSRENEN